VARPRLLTIAHSYVVALNRRLASEMARHGAWEVVAAAPRSYAGDLGPIAFEQDQDGDEGCRVVPVDVRRSQWPHVMGYGPDLRSLLDGPWDVIHCWEEPYVLAAEQIARWAPRSSTLVFATFQNIPKRYPFPFGWFERRSMQRADGWIAFGRTAQTALESRRGYAGRPHRVIPPGVDLEVFRPDPAARRAVHATLGWPADDIPVVGFLGRFVPEKGLRLLTEALDGVDRQWRALFVGGGPMEAELRGWASRHGNRVRIASGVRHADVPAHLNAMDLLCAPSQTTARWREQFGRMLVEAFACGVPVLASESGEIPHVVNGSGVLLPETDRAAWSSAIASMLRDASRRAELSAAGRARAERYSWPRVAAEHLVFFEGLRTR
jgi:glycosyltransferase involved in cell wall biosynthesis